VELNDGEYILLSGKKHPLWKGVLRVALENGLTELSVRLIQAPSDQNGGSAICEATALFTGANGQVQRFVEIGDCDGNNCGKMIAPHRVRMAATRAKGRALRDALGIGEAMAEEMGGGNGEEPHTARQGWTGGPAYKEGQVIEVDDIRAPIIAKHHPECNTCKVEMTQVDMNVWRPHAKLLKDVTFCQKHINMAVKYAEKPETTGHYCSECADEVEAKVAAVALQKFGRPMCVPCGRKFLEMERANIPTGAIAS
jgi:hypothetical protein